MVILCRQSGGERTAGQIAVSRVVRSGERSAWPGPLPTRDTHVAQGRWDSRLCAPLALLITPSTYSTYISTGRIHLYTPIYREQWQWACRQRPVFSKQWQPRRQSHNCKYSTLNLKIPQTSWTSQPTKYSDWRNSLRRHSPKQTLDNEAKIT